MMGIIKLTAVIVAVYVMFGIALLVIGVILACVLAMIKIAIENIQRRLWARRHKKKGASNGREHNEN